MVAIFRADPKLSAAKANAQFKAKFGSMMRTNRVYELRIVALHETPLEPMLPTPDDPGLLINILKPDDKPIVDVLTPKVFCGVKGCSGHEVGDGCSCPKPEEIPEVDVDPKDWSF
jgi:hypothetical protein